MVSHQLTHGLKLAHSWSQTGLHFPLIFLPQAMDACLTERRVFRVPAILDSLWAAYTPSFTDKAAALAELVLNPRHMEG